jgi:hypothetical protein
MTKICCVCHRVENGDHWKNDYVFAATERVTHGYCPLCFDVVMSELTDYYIGTDGSEMKECSEGEKGGVTVSSEPQKSVCA